MNDWIASLAKQSASNNNNNHNNNSTPSGGPSSAVPSKEERIQKRNAKKARRQLRQEERKRPGDDVTTPAAAAAAAATAKMPPKRVSDQDTTKRRLKRLAELLLEVRKEHRDDQRRQLYTPDEEAHRIKRKRPLNEINIQPQPSDYSGIGLARKSLFIPFQDPSHIPKLEQEFAEHIPGFFGKQRTKAMKKQLDGNMLWRKLADQKQNGGGGIPKKFAHLSPDERVQAMIDAGMV